MLHLLPDHQKRLVLKEYHQRVTIVMCWLIGGLAFLGILMLIPAYAFTHNQYTIIETTKQTLDKNIAAQGGDETAEVVKKINASLAALAPLGSKEQPSDVFDRIISKAGGGIRLTHFTYSFGTDGKLRVTVVGIASNRFDLTAFVNELQKDSYFEGLQVPLTSYTKETNLDFSFDLIVKGNNSTT